LIVLAARKNALGLHSKVKPFDGCAYTLIWLACKMMLIFYDDLVSVLAF
jgi:hypothetical protein